MDGLSTFITLLLLLLAAFIGLIQAETLWGVFFLFLLLTMISYTNIYLFNAE